MQDPLAEVTELQRREFSSSSAAVCRETNEEQVLRSDVTPPTITGSADVVGDRFEQNRLSSWEESTDNVSFEGSPRCERS